MTGSAFATNATITGTITDLSGSVVTSGQVTFSLQPSVDTTISGVARFVPSTVACGINGSGLVKNLALSGACTVVTNTSQTPSGTSYLVCIWPGNVKTSCFVTYITGDVDITTVNPTPTTSPLYNLVDTLNNQSIAGNKTFSGTTTLSGNAVIGGNETIAGTLGVTGVSTLTGAVAAGSTMTVATSLAINGGTALTTTNRTGTGNLVLATSPAISAPAITGPATAAQLSINGGTPITAQSGTGGTVVMTTGATLTTPTLITPLVSKAGLILANGANIDAATGTASFITITGPTGAFSTSGFNGGQDGRILYVFNTVAFAWTITNEGAGSAAANRITTLTGADVTLRAGTSFASFIYNAGASRWILMNTN